VGDLLSFASESVALSFEDDDLGVVDQAVDHGCDGYGIVVFRVIGWCICRLLILTV